jgi:hypothetical protein
MKGAASRRGVYVTVIGWGRERRSQRLALLE